MRLEHHRLQALDVLLDLDQLVGDRLGGRRCTASPCRRCRPSAASAAMISAWRALALSFSSSVILPLSRISACFWLAMTLAACSFSRRCCACASAIACSSCTLRVGPLVEDPVSLAVEVLPPLLDELEHASSSLTPGGRAPRWCDDPRVGVERGSSGRQRHRPQPLHATVRVRACPQGEQHAADVDAECADDGATDHDLRDRAPARVAADAWATNHIDFGHQHRGEQHPPEARDDRADREARHLVAQHLQRPHRRQQVGDREREAEPEHAATSDEHERRSTMLSTFSTTLIMNGVRVSCGRRSRAARTGRPRSRRGRPRTRPAPATC